MRYGQLTRRRFLQGTAAIGLAVGLSPRQVSAAIGDTLSPSRHTLTVA